MLQRAPSLAWVCYHSWCWSGCIFSNERATHPNIQLADWQREPLSDMIRPFWPSFAIHLVIIKEYAGQMWRLYFFFQFWFREFIQSRISSKNRWEMRRTIIEYTGYRVLRLVWSNHSASTQFSLMLTLSIITIQWYNIKLKYIFYI